MGVELKNVTKQIRGVTVLADVSAAFESGRITGLSGVNGSGKTMLMRVVCGLVRPDAGDVLVGGVPVGPGVPIDVGALIENPAFLPDRTGLANLLLLASIKGVVQESGVRLAIASFGLDPDDPRRFSKYSLGMKQRLGLACAFMERPSVLLLDEPTNALDQDGVRQFEKRVKQACDAGAAVVLACHDAQVLRRLADEIYYLAEGHIDGHEVLRGGGQA